MGLQRDNIKLHLPVEDTVEETGIAFRTKVDHLDDNCDRFDEEHINLVISPWRSTVNYREKFERLGLKERSMLITQPTVYQLDFFISCCSSPRNSSDLTDCRQPFVTLRSAKGMTVGHVLQQLATLQGNHRICPNGIICEHDKDGYVWPVIQIEGKVKVSK
jgi:hypothetical protein